MNIKYIAKKAEKILTDNSPVILTSVGVTGTIATALLTGKATIEAERILRRDAYDNQGNVFFEHDLKDRARLTWKLYIPPAIVGAGTVSAIVMANRIGTRRTAALAAAYSISERAYTEYRDKVVERLGESKEQDIRDEISQAKVNANPTSNKEVIIFEGGDQLFYESYTGRYFQSSMETVKKAMNDTYYQTLHEMYASLGDFQQRVGLPRTSISEDVGWTSDAPMDIEFSATISEDQRPCIVVNYVVAPVRNYHRFR